MTFVGFFWWFTLMIAVGCLGGVWGRVVEVTTAVYPWYGACKHRCGSIIKGLKQDCPRRPVLKQLVNYSIKKKNHWLYWPWIYHSFYEPPSRQRTWKTTQSDLHSRNSNQHVCMTGLAATTLNRAARITTQTGSFGLLFNYVHSCSFTMQNNLFAAAF